MCHNFEFTSEFYPFLLKEQVFQTGGRTATWHDLWGRVGKKHNFTTVIKKHDVVLFLSARCLLVSFDGLQTLPLLGAPHTQESIFSSTQQVRWSIKLKAGDGACALKWKLERYIRLYHPHTFVFGCCCGKSRSKHCCLLWFCEQSDGSRDTHHHDAAGSRALSSSSCHTAEWFHLYFLWRRTSHWLQQLIWRQYGRDVWSLLLMSTPATDRREATK